jgi:hypothetical protein
MSMIYPILRRAAMLRKSAQSLHTLCSAAISPRDTTAATVRLTKGGNPAPGHVCFMVVKKSVRLAQLPTLNDLPHNLPQGQAGIHASK